MSADQTLQSDLGTAAGSPAAAAATRVTAATRIPMSVPTQKLAVPEIAGYFLRWHTTDNVARALKAGYEFVDAGEVNAANFDVAGDPTKPGGSDMGSRISQPSGVGAFSADGSVERLYLMKLPNEFRQLDDAARDEKAEQLARRLRAGQAGAENDPDRSRRYMKTGQHLFTPKSKRGA